ncbi:hypothetical protein BMETH_1749_1 [methanotrophic bacterial endosymbiont of Bathymodiolus sp.]|nr:hypothetical protein BMETH_1749_1 [methanotrophic bacterial endosymbiont of Bathymodiolus sp.]
MHCCIRHYKYKQYHEEVLVYLLLLSFYLTGAGGSTEIGGCCKQHSRDNKCPRNNT